MSHIETCDQLRELQSSSRLLLAQNAIEKDAASPRYRKKPQDVCGREVHRTCVVALLESSRSSLVSCRSSALDSCLRRAYSKCDYREPPPSIVNAFWHRPCARVKNYLWYRLMQSAFKKRLRALRGVPAFCGIQSFGPVLPPGGDALPYQPYASAAHYKFVACNARE